jgi:hypothetical protein
MLKLRRRTSDMRRINLRRSTMRPAERSFAPPAFAEEDFDGRDIA